MGDVRGFMKYPRNYEPKEPVAERLGYSPGSFSQLFGYGIRLLKVRLVRIQ